MTYSSRVFVVAAVLVILALASYGSAFDVESLLRTAEQRDAYRLAMEYHLEDSEFSMCNMTVCDIPAGNTTCFYQTEEGNTTVNHVCTGYNFCNSSAMCEAKFPAGHECFSAEECEIESAFVQPECKLNDTTGEHVCEQPVPRGWVGDQCAADDDCHSNMCNTTSSVCEGLGVGEVCNATNECDRGLFCHSGACSAVLDYNATCSNDDECGMAWNGTACIEGHCLTPFVGVEGGSCSGVGMSGGFGACGAGLYCDGSVCKKFEKIECDPTNDTSCDSLPGTTCACNTGDGKSYCFTFSANSGMIKYFNEAVQCAKDHSCAINPTSGCFIQNCGDDLDCYASESFKDVGISTACYGFDPKCNKHDGSSEQPSHSGASRTTAAVVITALAAVAALL